MSEVTGNRLSGNSTGSRQDSSDIFESREPKPGFKVEGLWNENDEPKIFRLVEWISDGLSVNSSSFLYTTHVDGAPSEAESLGALHREAQSSISTASDATFNLAGTWIQQCKLDHRVCNELWHLPCSHPTRLLDLQNVHAIDRLGHVQLRLIQAILSEENTPSITYVTLSHRWGMSPTLRLLQGPGPQRTVEVLETGFALEKLPLTFQDAVIITKRLGFRYLWIDSLCIIQDSALDWKFESSIMGDIYRGSVCTIAALAATDSHGGCFMNRNPLMFAPCLARPTLKVTTRRSRDAFKLSGEILNRGWVVQERVLAPRTLFYGKFGIAWECKELQSTADGPDSFGGNPKLDFSRLTRPCECEHDISNPSDSTITFHKAWSELVRTYSSTELTKREDKFVAFQGIIHQVSVSRNLSPVAGMWKEILPAELLWCTHTPASYRVDSSIAPSWSWASVESPVTNHYVKLVTPLDTYPCTVEWKTRVLDIHLESKSHGEIIGTLTVCGPLRRFHTLDEQAKGGLLHQEKEWAWIQNADPAYVMSDWGFHGGKITRSQVFPDVFMAPLTGPLHVVWLARGIGSEIRYTDNNEVEPRMADVGLVLDPVQGHEDIFRRRGYFEQRFYGDAWSYLFAKDQDLKYTPSR